MGKGPLKTGTGFKANGCLNSSTSEKKILLLVIELKELKQNRSTLPAGIEDVLSKTQARCWEKPLEYAGLARMLTTGTQTEGPLEPDFHWVAPLLL